MAKGFPIVAITGPRQSGKTTLAKLTFPKKPYLSLEDPDVRATAESDPRGLLAGFPDGAILDEAQRAPQLFSYLQTKVDEQIIPGMFVLTGSQQFGLLSGITQSLAGRVGLIHLLPFAASELSSARQLPESLEELLVRGLYPPLYDRDILPGDWFSGYIATCRTGCATIDKRPRPLHIPTLRQDVRRSHRSNSELIIISLRLRHYA
jgi:predicted AAA+ superfamily ATPase